MRLSETAALSAHDSIGFSVKVISATAISGAAAGAGEAQKRLSVEVSLGEACQETKLQELMPSASASTLGGSPPSCGRERSWCFGDELTFEAQLEDLAREAFHVRLLVHNESSLNAISQVLSLHLQLPGLEGVASSSVLCEAELDVRRRVVAACVGRPRRGGGNTRGVVWESDPFLVPLVPKGAKSDMVCADVALVFVIDTDPGAILATLPNSLLPVEIGRASALFPLGCLYANVDYNSEEQFFGAKEPVGCSSSVPCCEAGNESMPIKSPDLMPDGWVCREGPGGRKFWHHMALGPPPWDRPFEELAGQRQETGDQAALVRSMMGRVASLRGARPVRQQRSRK